MNRPAPLLIRDAERADHVAIGELSVRAFVDTYAEKMPEVVVGQSRKADLMDLRAREGKAAILVGVLEGRIVGSLTLFRPRRSVRAWITGAAELKYLAIEPSLRGQGLSGPLLLAAKSRAVEWQATAICLHVRKGAHGVARLYERMGYQRDPGGDLSLPEIELEAYALTL